VYIPHTTAGITINESADPAVIHDIKTKLEKLVPSDEYYTHNEGNSDAHIRASLMGFNVNIPFSAGRLCLGTWQGIFFCEFDGPRQRSVFVQVIG
jgi:secondary thiamine-phosphate synthase enzyme